MKPGCVALLTLLCAAGSATAAGAQARLVVVPSISVGFVYDDNVFYEAAGNLEAIWRVTPGLSVSREAQRTSLFADINFDLERFREHPDLSTPLARQFGMLRIRHEATPTVSLGFDGGIESTRAPAEMNLTTGILTGRRRAMRFSGGPSLTVDVTPRLATTVGYTATADIVPEGALQLPGASGDILEAQAPASRLWTHVASGRLSYDVTPRHELRVDYVTRWFVFTDPMVRFPVAPADPNVPLAPPQFRDPIVRHSAFLGWTYRINPAVKLDIAAGPRFRVGRYGADDPFDVDGFEVETLLSRQRVTHDVFLSYVRTITTAVGLTSLMETDRAILRGAYRPPFGVRFDVEGGYYRSAIDDQDVTVYRVGGGLTLPLGGPVSVGVSYAIESQHGRFGILPTVPIVPSSLDDPLRIVDPDAPMRRSVTLIRLIIAPSMRPTPEEPPPGATPVRRGPVKRSDHR
jgi:hypothetical protein